MKWGWFTYTHIPSLKLPVRPWKCFIEILVFIPSKWWSLFPFSSYVSWSCPGWYLPYQQLHLFHVRWSRAASSTLRQWPAGAAGAGAPPAPPAPPGQRPAGPEDSDSCHGTFSIALDHAGCYTPIRKLPSQSLTWNLKMMVSKRNLLFQGAIFRFHVKFWEGNREPLKKWMFFWGGISEIPGFHHFQVPEVTLGYLEDHHY